jgi:hypothetical protein
MKNIEKKLFNLRGFVVLTMAAVIGLSLPIIGLTNQLHQTELIVYCQAY